MLDIEVFDFSDTAKMYLVDPTTQEKTDAYLIVKSILCDDMQQFADKFSREHADEGDRKWSNSEFIREFVIGWHGINAGGKPLEFNEQNRNKIVDKKILRAQIIEFVGNNRNFFTIFAKEQ